MHLLMSLSHLPAFLANHTALMPCAGLACSGIAVALLHSPAAAHPFGVNESDSIMNFSSLGTLRCICGAEHAENPAPDRRHFCRACGCEVVAVDTQLFEKQLSRREIKAMTRQLRSAAIRARNLELPPSITSVEELNRYLSESQPKRKMPPPSRPTPVEQPQIH